MRSVDYLRIVRLEFEQPPSMRTRSLGPYTATWLTAEAQETATFMEAEHLRARPHPQVRPVVRLALSDTSGRPERQPTHPANQNRSRPTQPTKTAADPPSQPKPRPTHPADQNRSRPTRLTRTAADPPGRGHVNSDWLHWDGLIRPQPNPHAFRETRRR